MMEGSSVLPCSDGDGLVLISLCINVQAIYSVVGRLISFYFKTEPCIRIITVIIDFRCNFF